MKKHTLLTAFFLFTALTIKAQSFIGFLTDNYSGVHGVISNPANIADSRFRTDINLAGASALVGNDYISISSDELFDEDADFSDSDRRTPSNDNNFFANTDILGPSFMFNLNDKSSVALFTRVRTLFGLNDLNGVLFEKFVDGFVDENTTLNEGNFNYSSNAWAEIGATYARELYSKEQHFVKGGVSLKYLLGIENNYASGNNVTLSFNSGVAGPNNGSLTTTGDISYGDSNPNNIGGSNRFDGSAGFGVDLGFVYEWRPDYKNYDSKTSKDKNKYKLKLGLSVTDLGSIKYKNGNQRAYDINNTISESEFDSADGDLDEILDRFYTVTNTNAFTKAVLPAALHINADYNIKGSYYLNLNTDLSLISRTTANASRAINLVSLTPRFERKWFSIYTPLSYMQHSGFQAGLGLRAGPLYIGSGSVITFLASDKAQAADAYVGLKIPIYQSKPKDKDGDGVLDKLDACKNVAGPIENGGCPWEDADGDSVLDKDDACPDVAGPLENKGCPWKDSDGDTVLDKDDACPKEAGEVSNKGCPFKDVDGDGVLDKDDACPKVKGPATNKGCPVKVVQPVAKDTDGDGVIDANDKCPNTKGSVTNSGCPEVSNTVQTTLNTYAKVILFNSGKSSIKSESYTVLNDIVGILRQYPNARFRIEGHTDSDGSESLNQSLSNSRANSVLDYLVKNGVSRSNLSAVGFGESYPITSNATAAGKKRNRRVEINLVK